MPPEIRSLLQRVAEEATLVQNEDQFALIHEMEGAAVIRPETVNAIRSVLGLAPLGDLEDEPSALPPSPRSAASDDSNPEYGITVGFDFGGRKVVQLGTVRAPFLALMPFGTEQEQRSTIALLEALNRTARAGRFCPVVESLRAVDGWGEHPHYARAEWLKEVAAQATQLGYWEWLDHRLERQSREDQLKESRS